MLSFIPIKAGTKQPACNWTQYQFICAPHEEVQKWNDLGHDLGLVTGMVSGDVEVIDFDKAALFEPWVEKVKAAGLTQVLDSLTVVQTIKGYHVYYRSKYLEGNQKLARAEDGKVLIETRGQGGYVITPSVNNARYCFLQGDHESIPTITQDERETLLVAARTFDDKPREVKGHYRVPGRPGDDYNSKKEWSLMLPDDGWTFIRARTDGVTEWSRPGKTDMGISATVGVHDSDLLYVFSSSVENLEPGAYTKFSYYAYTQHGGDFEAAATQLASEGYGTPATTTGKKANVAAKLYGIAADFDSFVGKDGVAYAYLEGLGVHPIESSAYKAYLDRKASETLGTYIAPSLLDEVSKKQAWQVAATGEERELFTRVGWNIEEEAVYVDLGERGNSRAVKITKTGWSIVDNPSVNFKRSSRPVALPEPKVGGDINVMRKIFNTKTDEDYRLLCSWIVSTYNPHGTFPILVIQGGPGAAKTTTTSLVRRIIDPAFPALLPYPRSLEQLLLNGYHNYVLAFDNLSGISNDVSDALCVLASGSGFATRKLYTNTEQVAFEFKRPIVINGIDHIAHRADFASRSLCLEFKKIDKKDQKTDKWLATKVAGYLPTFLGGVFDAVSVALRRYDATITDDLDSRLTDFTHWTMAALPELKWDRAGFIRAMKENTTRLTESLAEMDLVAQYALQFMEEREEFEDTPTEVFEKVENLVPPQIRRAKDWPSTPRIFTQRLLRAEPTLKALGVAIERGRRGNHRTIRMTHEDPNSN